MIIIETLEKKLGIRDNDILILQATRVTNRKAIELAIDVVGEMKIEKIESYFNHQDYIMEENLIRIVE